MKKEYISPVMMTAIIESQPLMDAASQFDQNKTDDQTINFKDGGYRDTFGSRRNSVWDDEEEY